MKTKDTIDPICPYCGHRFDTDNEYLPETLNCQDCGKTFKVEVCTLPRYSTLKLEDPTPPYWRQL